MSTSPATWREKRASSPQSPKFDEQDDARISPSVALQPELRSEWNRRDDRVTFVPFLRQDADDENRGHADIRELNWFHVDDDDILGGFARDPIIEIRLSWFF